jgi:hypothetical protein
MIVGWLRRTLPLGQKVDECATCGRIGPHVIVRRTMWFTLFFIPVLLVWVQHRLLCGTCGAESRLSPRQAWGAIRHGRLPLSRPRPNYTVLQLDEANGPTDPAALFDPVVPYRERTLMDHYTAAWPVITVLVLAFCLIRPPGSVSTAGWSGSPATSSGAWDALTPGTCFNDPTQTGATMAPVPSGATTLDHPIRVVDCAGPHQYEVFAVDDPPDGSYPGDAEISRLADLRCTAAFAGYVGVPVDASPLRIVEVVPNADSWAAGDRTYLCALYDRSNPGAVGSVKSTWATYQASWDRRVTISRPATWQPRAVDEPASVAFVGSDGEVDLTELPGTTVATPRDLLDAPVAQGVREGADVADTFSVTGTTNWTVLRYEWPDGQRGVEAAAVTHGVGLLLTLVPGAGHLEPALTTFEAMVASAAVAP